MRARLALGLTLRGGVIAAAVLFGAGMLYRHLEQEALEARLVRTDPDRVLRDAGLVRSALQIARPAYAAHCARCHGADLQGDRARGVPDLADSVWLYGFGQVTDIETTILYGVRSGHPKARNITDMPAFGRIGQLSAPEIRDVVEFVYGLSHHGVDTAAAKRGQALFNDKGSCYDCHGADATGNIDYGAPDLTGATWLYGGDRATLYDSVFNGRHGLCPAWIRSLSPAEVRALSVYLYLASHTRASVTAHRGGSAR
ncbi:MAG TPA: c-type cytochrome [Steroidobacteraceae bacterium]|nr:c-type cytochrome [Steroidobacteraceae bacterium]